MKYIIYKITIQDYIYIGSTKNYTRRKCNHKYDCINLKDILLYNKINEFGGWINCIMCPIEIYDCDNNIQVRIREEELRIEYQANFNMVKCYTTEEEKKTMAKEYQDKKKDKKSEYNKEYQIINKDSLKEIRKNYREANKDIIKEKKKTYYEANKDKILEDKKAYYKANKK